MRGAFLLFLLQLTRNLMRDFAFDMQGRGSEQPRLAANLQDCLGDAACLQSRLR